MNKFSNINRTKEKKEKDKKYRNKHTNFNYICLKFVIAQLTNCEDVTIYVKKYHKKAVTTTNFLIITEIIYKGNTVYEYDESNHILYIKGNKPIENIEHKQEDLYRRQITFLVDFAQQLGIEIEGKRSSKRATSNDSFIPSYNFTSIGFKEINLFITKNNMNEFDEFIENIETQFDEQMKSLNERNEIFQLKPILFHQKIESTQPIQSFTQRTPSTITNPSNSSIQMKEEQMNDKLDDFIFIWNQNNSEDDDCFTIQSFITGNN